MTQVELARRAGMSVVLVNHYVHGRRSPGVRNLKKLAKATGMSLERLCRGVGD